MCGGDLSRKLDWILRRTKQTKQASFVSEYNATLPVPSVLTIIAGPGQTEGK